MIAMIGNSYEGTREPAEDYSYYQQPEDSYAQSDGGGGSGTNTGPGTGSGTGNGSGVGGGIGGAKAGGTAQPSATPTRPKWKASAVIIPKTVFASLTKSMGPDGAGLDYKPTGMKKFVFVSGNKKQSLRMPKDFGILMFDENWTSTAFLWSLLQSVVQSGENVTISFATTINVSSVSLDAKQKVVVTDITDIMKEAGLTFASKDLTKKIYGSLLPRSSALELTSIYDNFSMIYLMSRMAADHTVVHELLGHFFLASKGTTYKHPDSLSGSGVVDNQGQPFTGTVIDFINIAVSEAQANLKSKSGAGSPAPAKP